MGQSLGGNKAAVFIYFVHMLRNGVERIMVQIPFQADRFDGIGIHQCFMCKISLPPGCPSVEEAEFGIGIPAPMPDPLSAIVGEPIEGIKIVLRAACFDLKDALSQFGRERFIGINR